MIFTVFQSNGKDLFLQNPLNPDDFIVKSVSEIPSDLHAYLKPNRKIEIRDDGWMRLLPTAAEIQDDIHEKQRYANLVRDINAYEAMGADNLPEHAREKLAALRAELRAFDPDPTATTMEERRARDSWQGQRYTNYDGEFLPPPNKS